MRLKPGRRKRKMRALESRRALWASRHTLSVTWRESQCRGWSLLDVLLAKGRIQRIDDGNEIRFRWKDAKTGYVSVGK